MPKIHLLDRHTAELIAAGEVVERPASVVKELAENSIDAGATAVTVEIKNGGVTFIRIQDNGCGIAREDVPLAFKRHATSKVRTEDDLESIGTLGFRGEALASVAAVARVDLITRTADEMAGTRFLIEGGDETEPEDTGCPEGTQIYVRDIFYNVPARMKFLKTDSGEANAVAGVVDRLALSHPEVSFRFVRDGEEKLLTPGDGDLRSCMYAVLGKEFTAALIPVDYSYGGVRVCGFISKPEAARSNRSMQFFFINGRYVKTRTAMAALEQAFRGSIMGGKFPCCVLHINLAFEAVDANVHPAKIEVRFTNEKPVFDAVYHGVKSALEAGDTPKKAVLFPAAWEEPAPVKQTTFTAAPKSFYESPAAPPPAVTTIPWASVTVHDGTDVYQPTDTVTAAPDPIIAARNAEIPPATSSPEEVIAYVGEAFRTYLIAQTGESLYLIDKHAAHERILYQQLKETGHEESQMLLEPVAVGLDKEEYGALLPELGLLAEAGFEAEDFGGSLLVRAVPMMLAGADIPGTIREIAGGFLSGKREVAVDKLDWLYHSVACRAAIKAGDAESAQEMAAFAERVLRDPAVRYCPHGRPVCVELTRKELEKQFGRTV